MKINWTKEADKIMSCDPEKYRDYHATILRHKYEQGRLAPVLALQAIRELIIKGECHNERVLEIIDAELGRDC